MCDGKNMFGERTSLHLVHANMVKTCPKRSKRRNKFIKARDHFRIFSPRMVQSVESVWTVL